MRRFAAGIFLLLFLGRARGLAAAQAGGAIGFRVLERADAARASQAFPKGRPIQIAVWYPAAARAAGTGEALTFGDLVSLTASETAFGKPSEAARNDVLRRYRAFLAQAGVTAEQANAWLATRMRANRDAPPAAGRFPLVVIAQGNGESAADQAFLAEIIAARGYAVATMPSQARIGGAMKSEADIPSQAEDQAADLAFAAAALRGDPHVDSDRYGLVAHSFGARSSLLLAMRDPRVAALVSLDGGIGAKTGKGLLDKAKGFDRSRAKAPILHFWEEGDRFMEPDLDLLRSLRSADRWLVRVDGMRHVHFSSTGILVRSMPPVAKITAANADTASAWDAVAEATAGFLDRFLRASGPATAPWSPPASRRLHPVFLPRS